MVRELFGDKGAFYDGSESDESENDYENYNKNIKGGVCMYYSK